jgi:hypothetical protein
VTDFQCAFDRDRVACGYAIDVAGWWWSILPFSDLAECWDAWSRRLEPMTVPVLVIPGAVLRGGGA